MRTYREVFLESSFGDRALAELFSAFGIVALVLAGAGPYAVVAYAAAFVPARRALRVALIVALREQ